jgi:23S rRNA U2552 (ribose-2'-O)-methylase RlmE/FtsJ
MMGQVSMHHTFDVVLSDMAPNTSGIKLLDTNASNELCEQALLVAHKILKPNGTLIMVQPTAHMCCTST